jgi:hypothetical protein
MSSDPKDGEFDRFESPTLVTCLACGGHWKVTATGETGHKEIICRWCTNGAMNTKQVIAWKAYKLKRSSLPDT